MLRACDAPCLSQEKCGASLGTSVPSVPAKPALAPICSFGVQNRPRLTLVKHSGPRIRSKKEGGSYENDSVARDHRLDHAGTRMCGSGSGGGHSKDRPRCPLDWGRSNVRAGHACLLYTSDAADDLTRVD